MAQKKKTSTLPLLQPIMEEHNFALQFCERIGEGLKKEVEFDRIREYTDWFQANYLEPHFEVEEQFIFPVLGNNVRVKRALANHRRIRKLLSCGCENEKVLNLLEEELISYIKFEEKILYKELQAITTPGKLAEIEKQHSGISFSEEAWADRFWIS